MSAMGLEMVLSVIDRSARLLRECKCTEQAAELTEARAVVSAIFTQPAQSVDVEKVREVIANIRDDQRLGIATADEVDIADKLTAALQEKGNG